MTKRILVNLLGAIFISLGIRFIITAGFGAFPIDSTSYFINSLSKDVVSLGMANFIVNFSLIIIGYFLSKNYKVFFGIILTFGISLLLDLWDITIVPYISSNGTVWFRLLLSFFGVAFIAIGSSLTIVTRMFVTPVDQMMVIFNKWFKSLFLSKLVLETAFLIVAVILGLIAGKLWEQIHWFTFIGILILSPMIQFIYHYINKWFTPILFKNKELIEDDKKS